MRTVKCDIWTLRETHAICIPINLGWTKDGRNVMGRGLAAQVSMRYPEVRSFVGRRLIEEHTKFTQGITDKSINEDPPLFSIYMKDDVELIFVPSKKLVQPAHVSWMQKSDLKLIARGMHKLRSMIESDEFRKPRIAVPQVGAGNGDLSTKEVRATIKNILGDMPEVTFVHYGYGRV